MVLHLFTAEQREYYVSDEVLPGRVEAGVGQGRARRGGAGWGDGLRWVGAGWGGAGWGGAGWGGAGRGGAGRGPSPGISMRTSCSPCACTGMQDIESFYAAAEEVELPFGPDMPPPQQQSQQQSPTWSTKS